MVGAIAGAVARPHAPQGAAAPGGHVVGGVATLAGATLLAEIPMSKLYSGDRGTSWSTSLALGAGATAGYAVGSHGMFTSMVTGGVVGGLLGAFSMRGQGDGFPMLGAVMLGIPCAVAGIVGGAARKVQDHVAG